MNLLRKLIELFDIPVPHEVNPKYKQKYEEDYQRAAAQLIRGQFDDLGESGDGNIEDLTEGARDALLAFTAICRHFIKLGEEKERKKIANIVEQTYSDSNNKKPT